MDYACVIIGVNYKSTKETINWAENICTLNKSNEILTIVVDNSSSEKDSTLETVLKKINQEIIYIDTGANLGYLPGANCAIEYLKKNNINSPYIIVCNVDIRFKSVDMIDKLLYKDKTNVGVFSPSIYSNGHDLNPYRINRLSNIQVKNRILYFKYPKFRSLIDVFRHLRKLILNKKQCKYLSGTKMYMTYGACFIFTDEYFKRGGDLKTPIFLYIEEPYVGESCRGMGLDIVYSPEIVIEDIGHVSTGQLAFDRHNRMLLQAATYVYDHYYSVDKKE